MGITNAHKERMLRIAFLNATPPSSWYIGLIASDNFTALNDTDTMASHSGWEEFTDYEGQRQPVLGTTGSAGTINPGGQPGNTFRYGFVSTQMNTNIGGDVAFKLLRPSSRIYGFFVTDVQTKGTTTGHLALTSPINLGRVGQAILFPGDEIEGRPIFQLRTPLIDIDSTP